MTDQLSVVVPENVTFEQGIEITKEILLQLEEGTLSESELEDAIARLVQTVNGARGFFVTYLTDERLFADQPSEGVIRGLASSPETVSELLVKNVVMSAAMVITHRRQNNEEMAESSEKVRARSRHLIQTLNLPTFPPLINQLIESLTTGEGTYKTFLERWGYDTEQREVMAKSLQGLT